MAVTASSEQGSLINASSIVASGEEGLGKGNNDLLGGGGVSLVMNATVNVDFGRRSLGLLMVIDAELSVRLIGHHRGTFVQCLLLELVHRCFQSSPLAATMRQVEVKMDRRLLNLLLLMLLLLL